MRPGRPRSQGNFVSEKELQSALRFRRNVALTPELATQFGTHRGALIAEVTPGGPAERAGLRTGDGITKVKRG